MSVLSIKQRKGPCELTGQSVIMGAGWFKNGNFSVT